MVQHGFQCPFFTPHLCYCALIIAPDGLVGAVPLDAGPIHFQDALQGNTTSTNAHEHTQTSCSTATNSACFHPLNTDKPLCMWE